MSHIRFFKSKTHRSDKSFMFWGFTGKVLTHKTHFINSSFPAFTLSFSRADHFKHFSFCHWLDFIDRNIPFACFLFTFLFDHVCEDLWISLLLSIHKICWDCAIFYRFCFAFCIFLFMLLDGFFHLNFLFEALFIKDFSFDASEWLCLFRYNFGLSGLLLSSLLLSI